MIFPPTNVINNTKERKTKRSEEHSNKKMVNISNETTAEYALTESSRRTELAFFTIASLFSLAMNCIVLAAFVSIKGKSNTTTIVCAHVTVSNLIVAINMPLYGRGDEWLLSSGACFVVLAADTLWSVSCLAFVFLTVSDRFRKIFQFYKQKNKGNKLLDLHYTLVLIWLSSAVSATVTFLLLHQSHHQQCFKYQHTRTDFYILYLVFLLILPLTCIIVMKVCVVCFARRHACRVHDEETESNRSKLNTVSNANAFYLSYVLMFCWLPYIFYATNILWLDIGVIYFNETAYKILKTLQFLRTLSGVFQPLVIMLFNPYINNQVKLGYVWILQDLLGRDIVT